MHGEKSAASVNWPSILSAAWPQTTVSDISPRPVSSAEHLSLERFWLRQRGRPQLKINVRNVKNSQWAGMHHRSVRGAWADPLNEHFYWNIEWDCQLTLLTLRKACVHMALMSPFTCEICGQPIMRLEINIFISRMRLIAATEQKRETFLMLVQQVCLARKCLVQ